MAVSKFTIRDNYCFVRQFNGLTLRSMTIPKLELPSTLASIHTLSRIQPFVCFLLSNLNGLIYDFIMCALSKLVVFNFTEVAAQSEKVMFYSYGSNSKYKKHQREQFLVIIPMRDIYVDEFFVMLVCFQVTRL